jgi:hypothetical protein
VPCVSGCRLESSKIVAYGSLLGSRSVASRLPEHSFHVLSDDLVKLACFIPQGKRSFRS